MKVGRFGPYIQCGEAENGEKPRNASLLKGMDPAEVDLETALKLLQLPRTLGVHPKDGAEIIASNGRYVAFLSGADLRFYNASGKLRYEGTLVSAPRSMSFMGNRSLFLNPVDVLQKITLK